MLDEIKILNMTKMAMYDKKYGQQDRYITSFFRHDYIYRNNLKTRILAFTGSIIIIVFVYLYRFTVGNVDIFSINYRDDAIFIGGFLLGVMIFYSFVGTYIYSKKFETAEKRLREYDELIENMELVQADDSDIYGYDDEYTYSGSSVNEIKNVNMKNLFSDEAQEKARNEYFAKLQNIKISKEGDKVEHGRDYYN